MVIVLPAAITLALAVFQTLHNGYRQWTSRTLYCHFQWPDAVVPERQNWFFVAKYKPWLLLLDDQAQSVFILTLIYNVLLVFSPGHCENVNLRFFSDTVSSVCVMRFFCKPFMLITSIELYTFMPVPVSFKIEFKVEWRQLFSLLSGIQLICSNSSGS